MYMMLSRLGKGVPHLDACMLALGTKQNKDMMVHMHPIKCAWMLAVLQSRTQTWWYLCSPEQQVWSDWPPLHNASSALTSQ